MPAPADPAFDHHAHLAGCARGEHAALAAIYRHEGAWLLGVALRIVRDRARAEDVLHDAFLRIWSRAASYDPALGSARGWIYSVVRHAALNHVRAGRREVTLDEESSQMADDVAALAAWTRATPAHEVGADLGRLQTCLEALPPERQDCIVLAYVDGCSHGEIAQRTGQPLGTVKTWLLRGLQTLRKCMA